MHSQCTAELGFELQSLQCRTAWGSCSAGLTWPFQTQSLTPHWTDEGAKTQRPRELELWVPWGVTKLAPRMLFHCQLPLKNGKGGYLGLISSVWSLALIFSQFLRFCGAKMKTSDQPTSKPKFRSPTWELRGKTGVQCGLLGQKR